MLRIAPARHRSRWRIAGAIALTAAAAGVLVIAVLSGTAGQSSRGPRSRAAPQSEVHSHPGRPAHMYEGDCDRLGEVKYALNPVGAGEMVGAEMTDAPAMAIGDLVGSAAATAVEIGSITLAVSIDEIVADELAVAIHRSESEYGAWVACGEVGGAMTAAGLAFGLREQNESGLSGVAVLTPAGNDTLVTIYLSGGPSGAEASPVSS